VLDLGMNSYNPVRPRKKIHRARHVRAYVTDAAPHISGVFVRGARIGHG